MKPMADGLWRASLRLSAAGALGVGCVAALNVAAAHILGPMEFGRWAAWQSWALMLAPFLSWRLETRVAACPDATVSQWLLGAISRLLLLSVATGLALLALASWLAWWWNGMTEDSIGPLAQVGLGILVMSATGVWIDAWVSTRAHAGQSWCVATGRWARQLIPAFLGLLCIARWPSAEAQMAGVVLGLGVSLVLLWAWQPPAAAAWAGPMQAWRRFREGLRASWWMGVANAVWLNAWVPAMVEQGYEEEAGQFALMQRVLGIPLAVLAMGWTAVVLNQSNALHRQPNALLRVLIVLAAWGSASVCILAAVVYGPWSEHLPADWRLDPSLFAAMGWFTVMSFAVGTVSVVAIRQADEPFLARWQWTAVLIWALGMWTLPHAWALETLLWSGGAAYVVLACRWWHVARALRGPANG